MNRAAKWLLLPLLAGCAAQAPLPPPPMQVYQHQPYQMQTNPVPQGQTCYTQSRPTLNGPQLVTICR